MSLTRGKNQTWGRLAAIFLSMINHRKSGTFLVMYRIILEVRFYKFDREREEEVTELSKN